MASAVAFAEPGAWSGWAFALLAMAAIFNPFVPLHVTRAIWQALNVAGALVLTAHYAATARPKRAAERAA